jgi:hypothetical protein
MLDELVGARSVCGAACRILLDVGQRLAARRERVRRGLRRDDAPAHAAPELAGLIAQQARPRRAHHAQGVVRELARRPVQAPVRERARRYQMGAEPEQGKQQHEA